jgi:hypothetical protein
MKHVHGATLDQILQIFNLVNKRTLHFEKFPSSKFPRPAMVGQIASMKGGGAGSRPYRAIMKMNFEKVRRIYADDIEVIESAARTLQIPLRRVLEKEFNGQSAQRHSFATAHQNEWMTESESESASEEEGMPLKSPAPLNEPQSQKKATSMRLLSEFSQIHRFRYQAKSSQATVRSSTDKHNQQNQVSQYFLTPRKLVLKEHGSPRAPSLLFRAFNTSHGLVSRRVLNTGKPLGAPPPMDSRVFRDLADPHLRFYTRYHSGEFPPGDELSPFISLTSSPMRVHRLILKDPTLSLALLSTSEVKADALRRYGDNCLPYPWLVPSIVKAHQINDLPGSYTGLDEVSLVSVLNTSKTNNPSQFLAWGTIECQPIAILENHEARALFQAFDAVQKLGGINFRSGSYLGPVSATF